METPEAHNCVPSWQKHLENATESIRQHPNDNNEEPLGDDDVEITQSDIDEELRIDWMQNMIPNAEHHDPSQHDDFDTIEYWSRDRINIENDPRRAGVDLNNWIKRTRMANGTEYPVRPIVEHHQLNRNQQRAFNLVKHYVESVDKQLLFRLEGTAGTGKSFFINAICHMLPAGSFHVTAATGKAANNVLGRTLHELLSIHPNSTMAPLTGQALKNLQDRMVGFKTLLNDEYSLVGCKMLKLMDLRLRQAFPEKSDQLFGGINMILAGDFKQIPPVGDVALWNNTNDNSSDSVSEGKLLFMLLFDIKIIIYRSYFVFQLQIGSHFNRGNEAK